jgi:signal transduction histidine kinase/CheY-like chemotaxis protein
MHREEEQIIAAQKKRFPFIKFTPPLERDFSIYRHERLLRRVPSIGVIGLIIFLIFAVLDVLTLPEPAYYITAAIRIFLICPLIGLAILASYQSWPINVYSYYCVVAYIIAGLGIIAIIYTARIYGVHLPYDGVLLHLVFGYFLMGLPFSLATLSACTVSAAYFLIEFHLNTPTDKLASNAFFIATLNCMGCLGSYMQERSRRLLFLNEQLVSLAKTKDHEEIQSKTRLVATASHDLRQPLHAMNLLVETLESQLEPGREHDLTQKLKESIRQLSQLLSSLLNISRLNAGIVEPKYHAFDLSKLISSLSDDQKSRAHALRIKIEAQGPAPCLVRSDAILIERIFRNLCENAFEHAQASLILVSWKKLGEHIRLEVKDNGQGIPEHEIGNIFNEFQQLGETHKSGMGLGLTIVKQLCDLLNIDYGVDSQEGEECCFWVDIQQAYSFDQTMPAAKTKQFEIPPSAHILLLDDDRIILDSMCILLESWGHHVTTANDPKDALSKVRQIHPSLIITDYRFPESTLNGLQFINQARKLQTKSLPAIIITADTHGDVGDDLENSLTNHDLDITQVAFKPLAPAKLKLMIQHYLQTKG